ncbi:hypothetical protein NE865_10413 [Phthorimaea operculella]|nr:hypothetical protein NE865_10413 [Phthorimaea operculella]
MMGCDKGESDTSLLSPTPYRRSIMDIEILGSKVGTEHNSWPRHLPSVRFAMNSARCQSTGVTPAYLTLARELRSPLEVSHDPRAILDKENFVPQITPYLKSFLSSLAAIREKVEIQQDKRKDYADQARRVGEQIEVGDKVLLATHLLSSAPKAFSSKFVPRRDGPYVVTKKVSPTTYLIAPVDEPNKSLGKFHSKELTLFRGRVDDDHLPTPVVPKRNRGRPQRHVVDSDGPIEVADGAPEPQDVPVHERGRSHELEGEYIANQRLPLRASRGNVPARYRT